MHCAAAYALTTLEGRKGTAGAPLATGRVWDGKVQGTIREPESHGLN